MQTVGFDRLEGFSSDDALAAFRLLRGFAAEVAEAFPNEIIGASVSKPSLEDVFIERTGHKFWTEKD